MDKLVPAFLTLALVALLLGLMWRAWRRRVDGDGSRPLPPLPESFDATQVHRMQYVATTRRDAPLERLALPGLAFRGHGTLALGDEGILLQVRGTDPTFVPRGALSQADTANLAIDRVVEPNGLVRIGWTLPDGTPCDTYLRVEDPTEQLPLIDALRIRLQTPITPPESEKNE